MANVRVSFSPSIKTIGSKLLAFADTHLPKQLDEAAKQFAYAVRDQAKTYDAPLAPTGRPARFVSDKQRRYVMAAIRDGRINVPYKRSGDMSRQTVAFRSGPINWKVEMRSPYAVYVRGDASGAGQMYQHTGRWKKFSAIVRDNSQGWAKRAREAVRAAMRASGFK